MTSIERFEVGLLATGGAASPAQTRAWGGIQNLPVSEVYTQTEIKHDRAV